jgi:hypothetical protein
MPFKGFARSPADPGFAAPIGTSSKEPTMTATKAVVASLCGIVVLLFGVPPAMATNRSGVLATIPMPSCCAVDEVAAAGGVVSLSSVPVVPNEPR